MFFEPEIILEDRYGSHQPAVFCEDYWLPLKEQGLGHEAQIILEADCAVQGPELARLTERASCAWMKILEKFVPEEGYHLGYIGASQALWIIPND